MDNDYSELIEYLDEKFQDIDNKFSQLPTKGYLDDKMANLEGGLHVTLRKEDEKINRLTQILREKKVLSDSDVSELKELKVFP
jgi:hypothetical protein